MKTETQKFKFYLDEKVTSWKRTLFEVEGKDRAEAWENAVNFFESGGTHNIHWGDIEDTTERIGIDQNGGQSTVEIYDAEKFVTIYENGEGFL